MKKAPLARKLLVQKRAASDDFIARKQKKRGFKSRRTPLGRL
jgi:hypothetical protein